MPPDGVNTPPAEASHPTSEPGRTPAPRAPLVLRAAARADHPGAPHDLLEPPRPDTSHASLSVERSFAFVDICGFTGYCERYGEHLALELLTEFRQLTRSAVARRGVRVSKWLGDGAMIVGLTPAILAAACAEIGLRCRRQGLDTHAGIATGSVLLLEGDDYVGRTVNLAARLCDAAEVGETLAAGELPGLPSWLSLSDVATHDVPGMDEPVEARMLLVDESIRAAFDASSHVA